MPLSYLPLRWEGTGDQWWYASPIDWAVANGHYDLVRELLSLDTNLLIKLTSLRRIRRLETVWDDEDESNSVAKCRSQVAQNLFLECEPSRTRKGHNSLIRAGYGGWLLYTACSAGDVVFVQKLLKLDPTLVFGEGEYGITDILYAASRSKNAGVFRVLLEVSGFKRYIEGESDENRLVFRWEMMNRAAHAAARGGNLEIMREIIGDNLDDVLGYRDAQGCTILHSASGQGQVEVVKNLIETFDVVTSIDNQGNTALHVAAYHGHLPVVKVISAFSHSITFKTNKNGDTFLHMIIAGFRTPGFRLNDRQIKLIKEVVRGKIVDIEDIVNYQNNSGRTALHMAVHENIKSEVVELLMSVFGINVNIRDNNGMTPLDLLKQGPRSASSEILIKRLIAAGGISKMPRKALVSHLKMTGIGTSPGTSFRVPDFEIFLYAGIENIENDIISEDCDNASIYDSEYSGEISRFNSPEMSNSFRIREPSSGDIAKIRLNRLFRWPKREKNLGDTDSLKSYESGEEFQISPVSLRERYSKQTSLPNSKRITVSRDSLPSPSTKKKFSARLMHGVIQTMPSPISGSLQSSPISNCDTKGRMLGKEIEESPMANLSFSIENSRVSRKIAPFDKKSMNRRYLCFGFHGLALEEPSGGNRVQRSYNRSSSLMT